MLIGRVINKGSGAVALDSGIGRIRTVGDQDFGFAVQDDQQLLLDVAMRWMRAMPRAQHRNMRFHAREYRGRPVEEAIGLPAVAAREKPLASAQVRVDRQRFL